MPLLSPQDRTMLLQHLAPISKKVDVLLALGHLASDRPDLAELQLDPLVVLPRGVRCLAARLRLAAPDAPPLLARALRPAPRVTGGDAPTSPGGR